MPHDAGPEPKPLRAVFFDFDGTLADSYPAITASVNAVRAVHALPPLEEATVRRAVGRGAAYLLEHTVPGGNLPADLERYRTHHPSVLRTGTRLMPGAADAVRALKCQGLKLGVCSNKPIAFTRQLLDYLDLRGIFDVVLGPEDVPHAKPAPDMLLTGLARLGVAAHEALYVGDMTVDIQTARAAGVRVWVAPTGSDDRSTLEAAGPDRVLSGLDELPALTAGAG
jgi:phosphoglycolate phosphatase